MKAAWALLGILILSGCATLPRVACPAGEKSMLTVQMFFGRNIGGKPGVSDADFRAFSDEELTPRFPDGLTVLDGGGQWKGVDTTLIREASKVVMVVTTPSRDLMRRIEAVRASYVTRFHQDSVMVVTQQACVGF
jgi:hypothetical protein